MEFLIHKDTEWRETGVKCPRCQERILRETHIKTNEVTNHFACERMGCTWPSFRSNQDKLIELCKGIVVIKKDMLFDDDLWEKLNKDFESRELKCVFQNQQEADAFDKAIKECYVKGETGKKKEWEHNNRRILRRDAIKWWNDLHVCEKFRITKEHNNTILSNREGEHLRNFKSLTGREIEMLYKVENK